MNIKTFARQYPLVAYFLLTFAISWTGAFLLVASKLLQHESIPKLDGLLMFPIMLLGPGLAGILFTRFLDGKDGMRNFKKRLFRTRVSMRWYLVLLIPPSAVLLVLTILKIGISADFNPNFFPIGILFGIPAGLIEELGWTGFAFEKMRSGSNPFMAAIGIGFLWGLWHFPVIDFLGTATPHGKFLALFFIVFILAMTAMRVIISWVYSHTQSIFLAQMMHISSTGSLVVFGPSPLSAASEAVWYGAYALLLWIIAISLRNKMSNPATIRPVS